MSNKTASDFSKVRKLTTVLRKCNGKAVLGDNDAVVSPRAAKLLFYCCLAVSAAVLFAAAYYLQPYTAGFMTIRGLAPALMLIMLIMSFTLGIKDAVTVLYAADDLEPLLPMPFTAGQIVMAKLAVVSVFPIAFSVIVLNSVCLGFGIREGAGAAFIIGIVLSSVLIPVAGIAASVLLVVIVFRVFGFIRNRDTTVALGGICTLGFTFLYIILRNSFSRGGSAGAAAAFGVISSVSYAFPNISCMCRFMFEGSFSALLTGLAAPVALILLAVAAVHAFYFKTALSMQNTSSGKKKMTKDMLRGGNKASALKALTGYEAKSSRRTPSYMIYGFAMSFLWPVLFIIPLIMGNDSLFGSVKCPLDTVTALLSSLTFAGAASCFSCGFNILPGTAFSREGDSFFAIRALPVDPVIYCRSKRNFALRICSLGSILYVVIAGIVCVIAGIIPVKSSWIILAGACISFLLNLIFVDLLLWKDSKKPSLNWDSETTLSRKLGIVNVIIIVLGTLLLVGFMLALTLGGLLSEPDIEKNVMTGCALSVLSVIILALAVNKAAIKAAAKNILLL